MTHSYVELELSKPAYDEIRQKLEAAGYQHAFMRDGTIDMHGIGVKVDPDILPAVKVEWNEKAKIIKTVKCTKAETAALRTALELLTDTGHSMLTVVMESKWDGKSGPGSGSLFLSKNGE